MSFHEEYHKWHSPAINRDFEMLTFREYLVRVMNVPAAETDLPANPTVKEDLGVVKV